MHKKNKKRGITLIELVIAVAISAILVSMIGPVMRYYMKITQRYNRGALEIVEVRGAFDKINELLESVAVDNKNKPAKNNGTAVRTGLTTTELKDLRSLITNAAASASPNKTQGDTLYIMVPVYNPTTGDLEESYHIFRFINADSGKTLLTYTNNLEGELPKYSGVNAVFKSPPEQYIPSGTGIKELVKNSFNNQGIPTNNYFTQIHGGVMIHLEYYKNPDAGDKNNSDNIVVIEKVFLKRGEM